MENKGLCGTCANDEDCNFRREFPVLQCEEFTDYERKTKRAKEQKKKRLKVNEKLARRKFHYFS